MHGVYGFFGSVKYIIGTIGYDYLYWFAIYSPSYTIFVRSGFRSILGDDRLILKGGGLGNYIGADYFQHELGQKIYFQVIRCQNTYLHPQQNFERGGGVRLNDLNHSV